MKTFFLFVLAALATKAIDNNTPSFKISNLIRLGKKAWGHAKSILVLSYLWLLWKLSSLKPAKLSEETKGLLAIVVVVVVGYLLLTRAAEEKKKQAQVA